jgi:hypothetical protein
MRRSFLIIVIAAAFAVSACAKKLEAPTDRGVCWHAATTKDGKVRFNQVAQNVPDLEHCAAQLEAMRLRFVGLGSPNTEIAGAYQGNFLFLQRAGVFTSQTADGVRYPFMVRTGDGRLAVPGAMPTQ